MCDNNDYYDYEDGDGDGGDDDNDHKKNENDDHRTHIIFVSQDKDFIYEFFFCRMLDKRENKSWHKPFFMSPHHERHTCTHTHTWLIESMNIKYWYDTQIS